MSTLVNVVFWFLTILAAATALRAIGGEQTTVRHRPRVTSIVLWLAVAIPSLLQLVAYPAWLSDLGRDWSSITAGQWWRLITAVVVQDGGAAGTIFNLFALAAVLYGVERYWSARRIWLVFWISAVITNVIAGSWLNPIGAGNSMATFALGCAVVSNVLLSRPCRAALAPALGVLGCFVFVFVAGNYHAAACLVGFAAGLLPSYGPRSELLAPEPGYVQKAG